jgi:ankyrin repeat protein
MNDNTPKPKLFSPRAGVRGMDDLQFAAYCGDLFRVKELLAAGADIAAADDFGFTALHWNVRMACAPGDRLAIIEALLDAGADANHRDRDGRSVVESAEEATAPESMLALLRSRGAR